MYCKHQCLRCITAEHRCWVGITAKHRRLWAIPNAHWCSVMHARLLCGCDASCCACRRLADTRTCGRCRASLTRKTWVAAAQANRLQPSLCKPPPSRLRSPVGHAPDCTCNREPVCDPCVPAVRIAVTGMTTHALCSITSCPASPSWPANSDFSWTSFITRGTCAAAPSCPTLRTPLQAA
jgi:hypothetical protein